MEICCDPLAKSSLASINTFDKCDNNTYLIGIMLNSGFVYEIGKGVISLPCL